MVSKKTVILSRAVFVMSSGGNLDEFLGTLSREEAFELYHDSTDASDILTGSVYLSSGEAKIGETLDWIALSAKARSQGHIQDAPSPSVGEGN